MCLLLTVNASSLDEPTHFTLEDISVEEEDTSKNAQTFKKYYLDGLRKNGTPIVLETNELDDLALAYVPEVLEYIALPVPLYRQDGQSWSNDPMLTEGYTIGESGCALTSFTMIANYYGSNDHPGEVNQTLDKKACPINWIVAGDKYGLTYGGSTPVSNRTTAETIVLGALRNRTPCILFFKKGSTPHFVVATGYVRYKELDGSIHEKFYINDPSTNINYDCISDFYAKGWVMINIRVYE